METIRRKNSIKYREMVWIDGKALKSPVFDRKTDARTWKSDQVTTRSKQQLLGEGQNLFIKKVLKDYSAEWLKIKRPSLQRGSQEEYERNLRLHINPVLGQKELKVITTKDIEILQGDLLEELSPKTTNCIIAVLRSVMDDALENGYITKDPCGRLKDVKEDPLSEKFWSTNDITLFWRSCVDRDEELFDFVIFALNTGLRRGEIGALDFDSVWFQNKVANINKTRDRHGTKNRTKTVSGRAIPLNEIAMWVLQRRFAKRLPGQKLVFTESNGSPFEIHHVYRRFGPMQVLANVATVIRFHDTRVTFATHFMMNGGDVYQLQKILGHTDIKMTMRYVKYSPKFLQDAVVNFGLGTGLKEFNQILTTEVSPVENVRIVSFTKKEDVSEFLEKIQ